MKLINCRYQNFNQLNDFISKNNIQNSSSLLIQIFSSNTDCSEVITIRNELQSILPNSPIIGTSTAGIISDGKIVDSEIIISFSIFESSLVKSKCFSNENIDSIVDKLASLITKKTKLLLCFADIMKLNSEELLKKITEHYPSLVIAGGNAADDAKYEGCCIFSDMCESCDVAFAAIDSEVLRVETKSLLNWKTIGKELTVTKADGLRLYEIDGKKALDVYEYYLGKEIRDDILTKSTEFPMIFNDNGIDVARAPIAVHDDGSMTLVGELKEGVKIKFGFANIDYIEKFNNNKLLNSHKHTEEAVYIYTCTARRSMLGNYLNEEVSTINNIAPTTGFVTYGEFFHDLNSHSTNLLNITTTYVSLNEQPNKKELVQKQNATTSKRDGRDITLRALSTLALRTSDELDDNIYYLEQFRKSVDEVAIFSTTDAKGKITYVNKNFEKISGYTKEELIGKSHNIVRHEDMSNDIFNDLWTTIKTGKIWKGLIKNKNKGGKAYYVLSEIGSIYNKDGSLREYIGIRNDVTQLEEYKAILKHELATTNHSLEENINYTKQYENAINTKTAILKTDINNIITFANKKFCDISGYRLDELIGLHCKVLRSDKHQQLKTCDKIEKILKKKESYTQVLTNITKDGKEYIVNNLFYPIFDLDGNVVEHLQLMYDLTEIIELNEEITSTQREVVLTMGAIGETRSKETGLHVVRVAEYSHLLAKLAGIDEDEANILKQASPMHDIGKVGIPDSILNKPGKLTTEEFEVMKTHAQLGYEMLKHSDRPILKTSSIVARTHHEKWDGSGYPDGTKGENIHIYGRITAIADVFDALGHDRCYKKAWKLDDILKLFRDESGKHFDPNLIKLFFDNLDQFLLIRDEFQD